MLFCVTATLTWTRPLLTADLRLLSFCTFGI